MMTKGSHPRCKVTDFGLAKMVEEGTKLQTACGTPTYLGTLTFSLLAGSHHIAYVPF